MAGFVYSVLNGIGFGGGVVFVVWVARAMHVF